MKRTALIAGLFFLLLSANGQDVKILNPSYVSPLDFSDEAKEEWALRDTLLHQLWKGKKSWKDLTSEQEALLEKYSEIYEDIWDIVGGGDSWYNAGGPKEVTASSYLKSQGTNSYEPKNAADLSYKNAWVEGVPGYGIGEYLLYSFSPTSPRVDEIVVVNGYVKSPTAWKNNSRVKKLKMYINDRPYAILNLKDAIAAQGFKVEPIGNSYDVRERVKNDPDWTLKFEILDVYKGLKYDDVAITEIYFDGLDVLCLAKGTKILMADHSTVNIEELQVGDSVLTFDSGTRQTKSARIEELESIIHDGLVTYTFASGLKITATQDHPFMVKGKGWASLQPDKSKQYKGFEKTEKLKTGDLFLTLNGTDELKSVDYSETAQVTYTISNLSSGDNFIANGLIVGIERLKGL